jgi:hypothetical protein
MLTSGLIIILESWLLDNITIPARPVSITGFFVYRLRVLASHMRPTKINDIHRNQC